MRVSFLLIYKFIVYSILAKSKLAIQDYTSLFMLKSMLNSMHNSIGFII